MTVRLYSCVLRPELFFLLFISIAAVFAGCPLTEMKREIEAITPVTPDFKAAADGKYFGRHDTALIKAEVEIEIRNGMIASAAIIKHDCGMGRKAEAVLESVVREQKLEVDAVAGATGSSRVILKAAEKALLAAAGGK